MRIVIRLSAESDDVVADVSLGVSLGGEEVSSLGRPPLSDVGPIPGESDEEVSPLSDGMAEVATSDDVATSADVQDGSPTEVVTSGTGSQRSVSVPQSGKLAELRVRVPSGHFSQLSTVDPW